MTVYCCNCIWLRERGGVYVCGCPTCDLYDKAVTIDWGKCCNYFKQR